MSVSKVVSPNLSQLFPVATIHSEVDLMYVILCFFPDALHCVCTKHLNKV